MNKIIRSLLMLSALGTVCCTEVKVQESRFPDGSVKETTQYIETRGSEMILHGARIAWYPNGRKEAMDLFIRGYQQGYAYRWHPNGKLKSVEHFINNEPDGQAKYWNASGEESPTGVSPAEGYARTELAQSAE